MQFTSGGSQDLRKIAAELGVAHILVGSVQRAGPQLRVNAQLIDTVTGAQIWAEGYDRAVTDVFALESELAEAMVAQLHAKLSPREKAAIAHKPVALLPYELRRTLQVSGLEPGEFTPALDQALQ